MAVTDSLVTHAPGFPLSALLSQVLRVLTQELEVRDTGEEPRPSLALWASVLRFVGEAGVDPRELPRQACLSKRAIRAAVAQAERQGWARVEPERTDARRKRLHLTERGKAGSEIWPTVFPAVEERWSVRFGRGRMVTLRELLESLVSQFELELPHSPVGYGPADLSITGGNGQDWSPVKRVQTETVAGLPLSALLSQVLVAFTMEYERDAGVALALSADIIRVLGPAGMPVKQLARLVRGSMSHLGSLQRHGYVSVEPGTTGGLGQMVCLTRRGQQVHDGYAPLLEKIERDWQGRYGREKIQALRTSLAGLVSELDSDLPHHFSQ